MPPRADPTMFDRYLVVDWSSASRPTTGKDSIWIADLDASDDAPRASSEPDLSNPPTRREAAQILSDRLAGSSRRSCRTIVAVDAPLGYPVGSADHFDAVDGDVLPWRAMWRMIADRLVDGVQNANNRFEVAAELNRRGGAVGPFWGRPMGRDVDGLAPTKPARFPVAEFRHCEGWLRANGLRPASCWQLMGAGSVGSQTLTLLPILVGLVGDGGVEVWPFTTGLRAPTIEPGTAVIAETWPTAFDVSYPAHRIRDAAQVHDVALALRAADVAAELPGWFAPSLDDGVDDVEHEEGWALVPPPELRRRTTS